MKLFRRRHIKTTDEIWFCRLLLTFNPFPHRTWSSFSFDIPPSPKKGFCLLFDKCTSVLSAIQKWTNTLNSCCRDSCPSAAPTASDRRPFFKDKVSPLGISRWENSGKWGTQALSEKEHTLDRFGISSKIWYDTAHRLGDGRRKLGNRHHWIFIEKNEKDAPFS